MTLPSLPACARARSPPATSVVGRLGWSMSPRGRGRRRLAAIPATGRRQRRGPTCIWTSCPGSAPARDRHRHRPGWRRPQTDLDQLVASVACHPGLHVVLGAQPPGDGALTGWVLRRLQLPPAAGRHLRPRVVRGRQLGAPDLAGLGRDRALGRSRQRTAGRGPASGTPSATPWAAPSRESPPAATAFPWRQAPFTVQWYAKLPVSHPAADVAAAGAWVAAARQGRQPDAQGAYVNYPSADVARPGDVPWPAVRPAAAGQGHLRPGRLPEAAERSVGVE